MGNDFKHLLNPDDAPPYRTFPRHLPEQPLHSLHSASPPAPSPSAHPAAHGIRPLTERTSAVPQREDRSVSRPGPPASSLLLSSPSYQSPVATSATTATAATAATVTATVASWTPVNRRLSSPRPLQIDSSSKQASRTSPEPRLEPRQLPSAYSPSPPQTTTAYFALPGTNQSSTTIRPGFGHQALVRPHSSGTQPKTPPSSSPSPVQVSERSESITRTYQDTSTQTSLTSNQQPPYPSQRQERSVRFKEEPVDSLSPRRRHFAHSPNSTVGDAVILESQPSPTRDEISEVEHTSSDISAAQTGSPVSPQPLLSPGSSIASLSQTTMSSQSGNVGASPPANDIYNIIKQVVPTVTNQQCQHCQERAKASYDKMQLDMSALVPRNGEMIPDFNEYSRRQEALLQIVRSHGKQMECDECQQRKERGYQERDYQERDTFQSSVGLNLLTSRQSVGLDLLATSKRENAGSPTDDLDGVEPLSQTKKRKMAADADHDDHQMASKFHKATLETSSPSPKCQTTPPPDPSSHRHYHISSVNGHPVPRQPVSRNVGRLFDGKGKSRSDTASVASPDIDDEQTLDIPEPKSSEKQRKDSGLVALGDGVDASVQVDRAETGPS